MWNVGASLPRDAVIALTTDIYLLVDETTLPRDSSHWTAFPESRRHAVAQLSPARSASTQRDVVVPPHAIAPGAVVLTPQGGQVRHAVLSLDFPAFFPTLLIVPK